jgi:hypothetical protein
MNYFSEINLDRTCGDADEDARLDAEDYAMASLSRPTPRGSAIPDWRPYEPVAPLSAADLEEVIETVARMYAPTLADEALALYRRLNDAYAGLAASHPRRARLGNLRYRAWRRWRRRVNAMTLEGN